MPEKLVAKVQEISVILFGCGLVVAGLLTVFGIPSDPKSEQVPTLAVRCTNCDIADVPDWAFLSQDTLLVAGDVALAVALIAGIVTMWAALNLNSRPGRE